MSDMIEVEVSKLEGPALDWAVAKCESELSQYQEPEWTEKFNRVYRQIFNYSTDWAQGGPIIEREGVWPSDNCPEGFVAHKRAGVLSISGAGPTPLVAAMRCFVTSKVGKVIEIPVELVERQATKKAKP